MVRRRAKKIPHVCSLPIINFITFLENILFFRSSTKHENNVLLGILGIGKLPRKIQKKFVMSGVK